jgi:hypothetical protein
VVLAGPQRAGSYDNFEATFNVEHGYYSGLAAVNVDSEIMTEALGSVNYYSSIPVV